MGYAAAQLSLCARSDNCSRHYDEPERERDGESEGELVPEVDTGVRPECVRVCGGMCLDDDGLTLTLCFVARCS